VPRSLGQAIGKVLKQTIIVENTVGAGGTIAPTKLKNAAPDGYTLLLAHIGMSMAPGLYKTLPFRPVDDFEHIGQVVDVPMTLIAKQAMPAKDLKELLAYIKAGRVKAYGTTSKTRLEALKELPALAEAGLPGFEVVVWHGVYAPKGTPEGLRSHLKAEIDRWTPIIKKAGVYAE
jgi:tripartite-type tricarboxylate transporter receptor subunit TctC